MNNDRDRLNHLTIYDFAKAAAIAGMTATTLLAGYDHQPSALGQQE